MLLLPDALKAARLLTGERDAEISVPRNVPRSSAAGARAKGNADAEAPLAPIRHATQVAHSRLDGRLDAYMQAACLDASILAVQLPSPPPVVIGAGPRTPAQETAEGEDDVSHGMIHAQLRTGLASLHSLRAIGDALEAAAATRGPTPAHGAGPRAGPNQRRGIEGDPSEAPILGSADRRTLNMLISIVNQWALDLVASLYDRASAATRAFTQRSQHIGASVYEIGSATDPYTRLRDISVAAGQALQMFAHAAQVDVEAVTAAAQAGKPAPPQPPVRGQDEQHGGEAEEPVSSLVLRSCAAPLFRLAFRVAFDTSPVGPAPGTGTHGGTHLTAPSRLAPAQVANALLKTALRRLSVLQCYAALSGVTARVHGGQPVRGLADAPNAGQLATPVPPPPGAAAHAGRFLSAQLLRPGGVRAMLSIMLLRPVAGARAAGNPPPTPHHAQVPEHAQSDVSDAVLEHEVDPAPSPAKVQRVVSLLSTPPPRLPMSHWLGAVVPQLLDLVTDAGAHLLLASVPRTARGTEDVHAATALTALQHLASLHPDVYTYLSNRLVFPFNPLTEIQLSPPQAPKLVSVSAVTLSLQTLLALLTLGPPDPTFLNTVLDFGHRVKPLLHLAGFLRQLRQDKASAPPPTAKVQDVVSSPSALAIDAAALAESVQFALGRWCSTRSADQHDDILSTLGPQPGGALSPSSVRLTDLPDTWSWGLEDDHLFVCKVAVDLQEEEASVLASLLSQLSTQEEKLNVQGRPGAAPYFDPIRMFLPALQVVVDLLDQVQAQDVERVSSFSKSKSTPLDTLLKLLLMELLRVQRSRHTSISERLAHSAVLLQGITLVLPRATPSLYIDHALPVLLFIDYALDGTMGNPERDPELETEDEVEAGIGVEEHIRPVGKDESLESHAKAQAILATGMRPAAASLLVELLYNNTALAVENTPLLRVVMDKLEALVQESRRSRRTLLNLDEDEPLSRVLPTLRLILRARSAGDYTPRPATDEEQNTPEHLVQQQYNESMALVQDPSIPVRGHGLVQLTQLVALNEVGASKTKKPLIIEVSDAKSEPKAALNPEQLEQVLNVFLAALDEEDSYVYMNAIKGLVQFALRPDGDEVFRRLIGMYVRGCPTPAPESTKTSTGGKWARNGRSKGNSPAPEAAPSPLGLHESVLFTAADVDRRLRVGETLGQVIQRMGYAVAPRIQLVVAPLLAFVRDARVPTTLCVSTISLLGTLVEAAPTPVALSGTGHELAGLALGLLSLEGARATFRTSCTAAAPSVTGSTNVEDFRPDDKDEDETFELQDNPVSLDRSLPQLRRAAFLLLDLLLVGTESQLSSRYDSPLDISSGPTLSLPQKTEPALLPRLGPREDNRTLLDRVLITRIRHLAVFASSSEPDPVAQDLARSCVEQTDAIAAALAQG